MFSRKVVGGLRVTTGTAIRVSGSKFSGLEVCQSTATIQYIMVHCVLYFRRTALDTDVFGWLLEAKLSFPEPNTKLGS